MREEFGAAYDEYVERTGMFLPTKLLRARRAGHAAASGAIDADTPRG